jgi:hypothetical protein
MQCHRKYTMSDSSPLFFDKKKEIEDNNKNGQ